MSWESPLEMMISDMQMNLDGEIYKAVQRVGITVDKDELIKALEYDRGQYEKGYADAMATIVRCKDCMFSHIKKTRYCTYMICDLLNISISEVYPKDFYCAFGERRKDVRLDNES